MISNKTVIYNAKCDYVIFTKIISNNFFIFIWKDAAKVVLKGSEWKN